MLSRTRKPPVLLVVVAVLIVLLPLLAYLQYDWLGKVSEREREQMQSTLRRNLGQFRDDFDREIARIFLQFDQPEHTDQLAEEYAKVYAHWNTSSPYPKLIRDIFLEEPARSQPRTLQHLNPPSGKWEPADWVTEFGPRRQLAEPVDGKIPALVIPIVRITKFSYDPNVLAFPEDLGQVIVRLNLEYIQKEFLPALVHSHFADPAADYKLQISEREDPSRVVYSTDGGSLLGDGDAGEGILGLRLHEFRGLMPATIAVDEQKFEKELHVDQTFSVRLFHGPIARSMNEGVAGKAVMDFDSSAWRVSAAHRAGSLDAAVAQLRRRNLGLSFGILALLATGVAIVLVSANRAQQLARQQMEFVSTVSHELRTPLAVICSAGDNIADGVVREPDQFKSYGKLVRNEGRRLTEMVEQVLSFAGIQSGLKKYALVPTDVPCILDRALSVFEAPLRENGFTVEQNIAEDAPKVMADQASLTRAVQNLISNAIKYSGASRWIGVSVFTEGRFVKLAVRDSGLGIAAADLPHIFEPFYRGRAAIEAQIQGSGLGLNLVKQTVEGHGGELTVTSNPGGGSTFCISLTIV